MSIDARFQVLQGKCVGGSTVVNNAVCYDLPTAPSSAGTTSMGSTPGLDPQRLADVLRVAARVAAGLQPGGNSKRLQAGGTKMAEGIEELGLDGGETAWSTPTSRTASAPATATSAVPTARSSRPSTTSFPAPSSGLPGERLRIFSECLAEHIETKGRRATEVRLPALGTAAACGSPPTPWSCPAARSPRACCSSAAASAASSPGPGSPSTSARRSPPTSRRSSTSFDGLQITHGYRPPGEDQLILESWFNPVGHPGADDARLVLGPLPRTCGAIAHLSCIGVVVGSQRNGTRQARLPRARA